MLHSHPETHPSSHFVMAGVDLATVMELLGPRDIQTTLGYAHLAQDQKWEAIAKVGRLVAMDTDMDTKPQEGEKGLRFVSLTPWNHWCRSGDSLGCE